MGLPEDSGGHPFPGVGRRPAFFTSGKGVDSLLGASCDEACRSSSLPIGYLLTIALSLHSDLPLPVTWSSSQATSKALPFPGSP